MSLSGQEILSLPRLSQLRHPGIVNAKRARRGSESNRCIRVLQTLALPLGYAAVGADSLGPSTPTQGRVLSLSKDSGY